MILYQNQPIDWSKLPHTIISVPAKYVLLEAGKVADKLFVIQKGAARMWFNNDGEDVTLQFFFDESPVCSLESFIKDTPSDFSIETLEPSIILIVDKVDLLSFGVKNTDKKELVFHYLINRMIEYTHLFLSRIKDTPQQRYMNLLKEHPNIVRRVAQHYIASYLGITSVSLSRIKARR